MQYEDAKAELLRHGLKAENFHSVVEAVLSIGTVIVTLYDPHEFTRW